jgi:hypothetical protein
MAPGSVPEMMSGSLPSAAEHPVTAKVMAASTRLATFVADDFSVLREARRVEDCRVEDC